MIQTYIYTTLMLAITLFFKIKKYNKMGLILMALYSAIGVMASVAVRQGRIESQNLTMFPFIFLILIYIIVFSPFLCRTTNLSVEKLKFNINQKYIIFAYIFIITSLVSISFYFPQVLNLLSSGAWNANRASLYDGTLTFNAAWYQYYSLQFSGYTRLLGILIGFVFLKEKQKELIGWGCIIVGVATEIFSAMYTSSRGAIVNIVLLLIVIYIFFYNDLKKGKRRFFVVLGCLTLAAIVPYVIDVTVSRFSDSGASSSFVDYLGQAPVVFNYGVAPINKHLYGEYTLGKLFGGRSISPSELGGSWGSGFYTFVGWLFIDWGGVGTIVVASLIAFITYQIIKKEAYSIAELFLVFFIYYTLLQGVFVIGRAYIYNIVATVFIYWFVKLFFEKYTIVIGRWRL